MKKLLFLSLLFVCCTIFSEENKEYVIEKTGFYGVYVKSIPFWRFWQRDQAIALIAQETEHSIQQVDAFIGLQFPIFYTGIYEEAVRLKNKLQKFDCELEIKEMRFSVVD